MASLFLQNRVSGLHLAVWRGMAFVLISILLLQTLYFILQAIYNLYLHPLRSFPGTKSWIVFPILRDFAQLKGQFDHKIQEFHEKYGGVVRWAPNEISFTSPQAWKDIYGHGHAELLKYFPDGARENGPARIISANAADHFRFRRAMFPAFSDKALGQQEPLIAVYVDLLVHKLRDVATSDLPTNLVQWFTPTTFDLIGDLAFGESFDGLRDTKSHDWITNIEKMMKLFPILTLVSVSPLLSKLLLFLASDKIKRSREHHFKKAEPLTMKRINNAAQRDRGDFTDHMMRSQGQKHGLSNAELVSNSDTLIVAGSETTATLLSGVTYYLLANPTTLKKATLEVRSAFQTEAEISFRAASIKLPYTLACLNEGLRIFPPIPTVLQRQCLPGGLTPIDGKPIPEKASVPS